MAQDVLGYLQAKGLNPKRATATEIHMPCPFCGEDQSKRGRCYVNVDVDAQIPGLFKCFLCDAHGSLVSLKRHFGDPVDEHEEQSHELFEIFRVAAGYYHEHLGENAEAYQWLTGPQRNLSFETIVDQQIGYASGGLYGFLLEQGFKFKDIVATGLVYKRDNKVADSLRDMVTIPYFVSGNCVGIRGRTFPYEKGDKRPKYKTCGGSSARLFNTDAMWSGGDEIVVCEGEFDAMSMEQLGFPAVGVPGANIWQAAWDDYLSDMKRVWLVFDQDKAGDDGVKKLTDRFGSKIKRIRLEKNGLPCDVSDWVVSHTSDDFRRLQGEASIGGLLVTVDQARTEHSELQGLEGIKFNNEELDHWIKPGLLPAQLMVVLAKAATGKTVWLLNVMQQMSMVPGQEHMKFLFVSLEQTRGEWFERARRIHRFYDLAATDRDCLDYWRDRLMIIDKNMLTEKELLSSLDDYEYRMGGPPDVVIIDYLGYWARGFRGDAYQRTSDAIMALKAIAKDRMVPIITPHQVSRVAKYGEEPDADAARDAGVVEETADFLFILWTPDAASAADPKEKSGVINMKIGKSRHGGRGIKVAYQFAPLSLTLVPLHNATNPKDLNRARSELVYEGEFRDKWEQAVYRHRTGFQGTINRVPGYQDGML